MYIDICVCAWVRVCMGGCVYDVIIRVKGWVDSG